MNSFKLLVAFILLLFGSFSQRFQRHLIDGTQNGYINGNTKMDYLDNLASDGETYVQNGDDVKFVRGGGEIELKFHVCYDGCLKKTVRACYDSPNPNPDTQGEYRPGQYEFKAGVSEDAGKPFLWFKKELHNNGFGVNGMCITAIMKYPEAISDVFLPFQSCNPLKHDGNAVKLYVQQVPPGCPFYVENAKKWILLTITTTSQNSSDLSETCQTTSKSSEANTAFWIGIGVGIFTLLIVVIIVGCCCYRTQIQKKPLFGKKQEVRKRVIPKEKKAIVEAKPSKEITQEDNPPPAKKIEPTLENPTTEASVVQKSVVQQKQPQPENPPRIFVPKKVILPVPKSINAPKSSSRSGKKDPLSGRHEIGMQGMVESALGSLKHHDFGMLNDETKAKLAKFYPPGPVLTFDRLEIELFCCARRNIMLKAVEALVGDSMKVLNERGVTFDEKSNIIEMSPKLRNIYVQNQHQNLLEVLLLEAFFVNILILKQEFMKHFQFLFFGQLYFNVYILFLMIVKLVPGFVVNFQLSKKNSLQKNVQN